MEQITIDTAHKPDPKFTQAQDILRTLKMEPNNPNKETLLQQFHDLNNSFDIPHSTYYFGVDIDLKTIEHEKN